MSGRLAPLLVLSLCLVVGSVHSQGSPQDAFIIQYMERRLIQMEVSYCKAYIPHPFGCLETA